MNNQTVDLSSNRSDINLIKQDDNSLNLNNSEKDKDDNKNKEERAYENQIKFSENISEVSANDYGYFTLKINHEDENKYAQKTNGFLGVINKAIGETKPISLKNNNLAIFFNKKEFDYHNKKEVNLVNNDLELLLYLGREENDFKSFKVIDPNEKVYKSLIVTFL